MKPVYLEFCGINSFSERAQIDFESLLNYGLFGVFGDTGSGKSTILDCIGFALYGDVARSRSGSIADIINYKADRAFVNFEFYIAYEGKRRLFRAEREIKRKNAAQSARVYEKTEGALLSLAEGVRDCNALLKRIVGLEQRDFEKCIALPQGEFAQFVRAPRGERLKLVSRLFGLEEYGERLSKRVNGRYAEYQRERDILQAKLEPFAEITEEENRKIESRIAEGEKKEIAVRAALANARAEEKRVTSLFEKGQEAEKIALRLAETEEVRAETEVLKGELSRLEHASAVVTAQKEEKTARARAEEAAAEFQRRQLCLTAAETAAEQAKKGWNAETADEEILKLSRLRAQAEQAAAAEKKIALCEQKLSAARAAYAQEKKAFGEFSYKAEKTQIEEKLRQLGGGDFLNFLEERAKGQLLRGEYAQFANELRGLTQKHPVIEGDTRPMIERYSRLSEGDNSDFAQLRAQFEAGQKERDALQKALLDLEKRNGQYAAHCEKLQRLQADGERLKEEIAELLKERKETDLTLEQAEKTLAEKQREKREKAAEIERTVAQAAEARSQYAAAQAAKGAAEEALFASIKKLEEVCFAGAFQTAEEAVRLTEKYGDAHQVRARVERFEKERAALNARYEELTKENLSEGSQEKLSAVRELLSAREAETEAHARELALLKAEIERKKKDFEKKCALEKQYAAAFENAQLYERLKKLLDGNKFMEYVAEEYLQTVALSASGRLLSLTDGRYFLRYDGGFAVGDNFDGGAPRGVHTLSGGETFLVSLSLALALSAEICARSLRPIEFFFLDEGFGTLDERLVDTVMDSLEKLKNEHFSIGIISHVEELKHRIDRKLTVVKANEKHGSQIQSD